jgi:hypothetical protein
MNVLDYDGEVFLDRIDKRLDEYKAASVEVAKLEAAFKGWEASRRVALIDSGKTATLAGDIVRGELEWATLYIALEDARIKAEDIKSRIQQGVRYWETWRSKHAIERRVTS